MIQLILLLLGTAARRLMKMILAKNPQGRGAARGGLARLVAPPLGENRVESSCSPREGTSRHMTRKSFHFQGTVNPPIILRRDCLGTTSRPRQ